MYTLLIIFINLNVHPIKFHHHSKESCLQAKKLIMQQFDYVDIEKPGVELVCVKRLREQQ